MFSSRHLKVLLTLYCVMSGQVFNKRKKFWRWVLWCKKRIYIYAYICLQLTYMCPYYTPCLLSTTAFTFCTYDKVRRLFLRAQMCVYKRIQNSSSTATWPQDLESRLWCAVWRVLFLQLLDSSFQLKRAEIKVHAWYWMYSFYRIVVISGFDRPGITGLADFDSIWIAGQYTIYLSVCPWCCMFTILHRWIRFSAFLDWPHPFWNGLVNRRYGGGDIRHVQHHYSHLCRSHHERLERFRERTEACFEKWTSWMTCIFCWSTFYQRPRGAEQKEILL